MHRPAGQTHQAGQGKLPWIAYSLRDFRKRLVPSSPATRYLGIAGRSLKTVCKRFKPVGHFFKRRDIDIGS